MAIARTREDLDTHTYWMNVKDALTQVCRLSLEEAANELGEMRLAMSCLSEWGNFSPTMRAFPKQQRTFGCGGAGKKTHGKRPLRFGGI